MWGALAGWAGGDGGAGGFAAGTGDAVAGAEAGVDGAFADLLLGWLPSFRFRNVVKMCARKPSGGSTAHSSTECTVFTPFIRPAEPEAYVSSRQAHNRTEP